MNTDEHGWSKQYIGPYPCLSVFIRGENQFFQSAIADSKSDGVPKGRASRDLSMRLHRPASTLPGPHSATRVAPRSTSACTQLVHCTGRYSWRTSASRI